MVDWPASTSWAAPTADLHDAEFRQLESERDALAEKLGHTFEELHWLRTVAMTLASSGATAALPHVAHGILPQLRSILGAAAVMVVPGATTSDGRLPRFVETDIVQSIDPETSAVDTSALMHLASQLDRLSPATPVVFNRNSHLPMPSLETSATNLVAVPLVQCESHYGWLIAWDRIAPHASHGSSDLRSTEFGSYQVGLLTTAASMLAGHARNVELFRAEEGLRVNVIEAITGALDARDPYTCGHSRRVGTYASALAERCGFTPEECERIYVTGLLHDVGKIGIPDDVLKKTDRLTEAEFDVIKQHPTIGHAILSPLKRLAYVLPGVLHHHERMDGAGYPHGLAGHEIPTEARILAVVDGYDAMTSNRAYRKAMTTERAREILQQGAGTQWDASIVSAFLELSTVES